MSTSIQGYIVTLLEKKEIAKHVFELRFSKPEGFSYTPGQFVQFLIPNLEKKTPRAYSISSLPNDDYLEFCIKFLDGGIASEYFRSLNIGVATECKGPLGRFMVKDNPHETFFVATGVGLAPIIGMIRSLAEKKNEAHKIHLLFGVREEDDLFWIERLESMKQQYPQFDFAVTLSRPTLQWTGLKGRVTDHILQDIGTHACYLCGNVDMVKDVRTILLENGVHAENIHFEIF